MPKAKLIPNQKEQSPAETLKGWQQIAAFLGEPTSVVQRWASEGMPVIREGRFVTTTPEQLNVWLGKESGKPVHVVTDETDLAAELKRGLSFVRAEEKGKAVETDSAEQKKAKKEIRSKTPAKRRN